MNGWSYDYMLALDDDNCPTRAAQRKTVHDQVEANVKAIATAEMPEIQQYFDKYGWSEFCNTVNWAYTESIELTIPQDIEKMQSTCNSARKNETLTYYTLDKGDSLKGVTTNELRKNLKAQIDSWVQPQAAVGQSTAQKSLEGTAGSEHPKYVMLWTNERLLSQIALSMSQNKDFEGMLPLGPSATIVLEFTQDSPTDDLNVRAFINDQLVDTYGCLNQNSCKATDFSAVLGADLDKAALDVPTFCGASFAKDK